MTTRIMTLRLTMLLILLLSGVAYGEEFPGRAQYTDTQYIDITDLHQSLIDNSIIVVDVRSQLEFDTIHVTGAQHIALSNDDFIQQVKSLRNANPQKKIAFYCNGISCLKSYEAASRAGQAGIKNTYAFDLGIPGWAEYYPEQTLLLDKQLSQSKVKWIPKSEFKKICLDWQHFLDMAEATKQSGKTLYIIDFRDVVQRGDLSRSEISQLDENERAKLNQFRARNDYVISTLSTHVNVVPLPLDKFINTVIKSGKMKNGRIMGFDQVGKQVRWLMYYLDQAGYKDYYFLDKGISKVIETQVYL